MYRTHLEGPTAPSSVVLKFPTLDQHARSAVCEPLEFYLREVRFYQEIGLANPLPPARPYFAAFDEATHDFVLVLEDLRRLRNADQTVGCPPADAETVVDAIARHHAYWWESDRLAAVPWLKPYTEPPFPETIAGNFATGWPRFLEVAGGSSLPELRAFGERFPVPRAVVSGADRPTADHVLSRRPTTGSVVLRRRRRRSTGDGAGLADHIAEPRRLRPRVFPEPKPRHRDQAQLRSRSDRAVRQRLAEHGIDYPATELRRDYRLTTAWCFVYPVISAGQFDIANDRQVELLRTMTNGAAAAIEDHDSLALRPD